MSALNPLPDKRLNSRVLDRVEQGICVGLYVFMVRRMIPATTIQLFPILMLISEGAVLVFLLLRKSGNSISVKLYDWIMAAAGTFLVLLVGPGGKPISPWLATLLLTIGMCIHIGAKLSLNLSFGLVAANRGIKSNGMYRFVRHPMYAGYIVCHIGFLLFAPALYNIAIYLISWGLFIIRIEAEEAYLKQDPKYVAFCEKTKWRLFPGLY
jgi:protein-S-isoprenylcysteine O-methyltransferase Ste14